MGGATSTAVRDYFVVEVYQGLRRGVVGAPHTYSFYLQF